MQIKQFTAEAKKKAVAVVALSVLGVASFGAGISDAYHAVTSSPKAVAMVESVLTVPQASALTASGGVIVVETSDTTIANDASTKNLQSMFEIIKFLPTMALISGGMYVLSAVMNILPKGRAAT